MHNLATVGNVDYLNKLHKSFPNFISDFINAAASRYIMPLHSALEEGHLDFAKVLLSHGASPHTLNHNHRHSLHLACQQGLVGLIPDLLSTDGMGTTVTDCYDANLLHLAIERNQIAVVKLLLAHKNSGAWKQHRDFFGRTPFDIAVQYKHDSIISLLGGDPENAKLLEHYGKVPPDIPIAFRN